MWSSYQEMYMNIDNEKVKLGVFDTPEEAAAYIEGLRNKKTDFVIVSREEAGGKYRIRVKEQYNKSPMIQD